MAKVVAQAMMSLDGYVAKQDNTIGLLFDWLQNGDVAIVNGTGGAVEQINLRTIVIRDMEGTVHVIPNGQITTLANRSKDFSYYVLDLGIDYDDDVVTVRLPNVSGADPAQYSKRPGPHW